MKGAYAARAAVAVLALVGGAVVGVCVVALHQYWWGLLVGVAATAALLVAVPGGWWRRLPLALGWFASAAVLSVERPEGDFLVEQSVRGYALLGAGVGVLLAGVVGLRHHPSTDVADDGSHPSTS